MIALLTYPTTRPALRAGSSGVHGHGRAPTFPALSDGPRVMKQIKIDLAGPFEEIVAKLLSIPPTDGFVDGRNTVGSELSSEMAEVLRSLCEAACGRQVATQIGLVQIAPPVAAFLKDAPFYVETHADLLLQALARLYAGSRPRTSIRPREIARKINNPKAEFQASRSFARTMSAPAPRFAKIFEKPDRTETSSARRARRSKSTSSRLGGNRRTVNGSNRG